MLFNTLLYAQFFAVVFGVSWLLVRQRTALFLPWYLLAGCTFAEPGLVTGLLALASFGATYALYRRSRGFDPASQEARITWQHALSAVLLNLPPLVYFATRPAALGASTLLDTLRLRASHSLGLTFLICLIALGLLLGLMTARRVRLLFVLGASYFFYAQWDWRFLPLIWASSTIDWLLGNAIARAPHPRRRKVWLVSTVALNLGVLAVFKYFNFGVDTAATLLAGLGFTLPRIALEIALPIGISFFTFESMSYVIDVYRRQLRPHPSYVEYLSFVAFFPHLVAGPIVRPRDLLPQLSNTPRFNSAIGSEALFLIAVGLMKKVAIGDYLALNLVDRVFDAPAHYSALECYAAVLGYAVQIYCDFSGYTDMAIGSALLLGVRFPPNFNAPYKAANLVDFWRRWHISLSTWLRDYLYIPLSGNRGNRLSTYRNVILTMLLGGLWHGASFTFVVWGGMHGVGLAITRAWQERRTIPPATPRSWGTHVACVLATFHVVCAAWIFFRASSFTQARDVYASLATLTTHHGNLPWPVVLALSLGLLSHWAPERWYQNALGRFQTLPAPAQGVLLFGAAWAVRQMSSADAVPFVYFQF